MTGRTGSLPKHERTFGRGRLASTGWMVAIAAVWLCSPQISAQVAPSSPLTVQPVQWMRAAAENETHVIDDDGTYPLRYRAHKIDAKGDTLREIVETDAGAVARLVERNGQPLTTTENDAERGRLQAILDDPRDFIARNKKNTTSRNYSKSLILQFPSAMLLTYAPSQPPSHPGAAAEVVIDFTPNPSYKPPTLIANALTGIEGRVWIDTKTQHVTRIEGRCRHAVDFGWGFLARIYPGGTVEFDQINAGENRWVYSHLVAHLTIRELLFRTTQENTQLDYFGFQLLPQRISAKDGVRSLLNEAVPTK